MSISAQGPDKGGSTWYEPGWRMLRLAPIFRACLVAAVGVGPGILACGGSQGGQDTWTNSSGLPPWTGRASELFGDNIDAAAVGLTLEGPSPRSDPLLRERAQTAELVARVRVSTVTVDSIGDESSYHLVVQVGYPPLATPKLTDKTLELGIRPTGRAFGIAKAFDARLQGRTFIGFFHRFAGELGEVELHWHLSADVPEVAEAVKEAVALGELSSP